MLASIQTCKTKSYLTHKYAEISKGMLDYRTDKKNLTMKHTKQQLLDAVNDLILDPDPRYKLDALEQLAATNRNYPAELTGELAVLNPLLELMLTNPAQTASVRGLIDQRREASGLEPCWPPEPPSKFKKAAYQRTLMAIRRERAGRAVAIENMQRAKKDRIVGIDRLEFERRILKEWGDRSRALVDKAREDRGGTLTRDQMDLIRMRFWESLDGELNEKEAAAKAELLKPAHQRRKV